jgi:hypothetical protein
MASSVQARSGRDQWTALRRGDASAILRQLCQTCALVALRTLGTLRYVGRMNNIEKRSPIEVWLSQRNMEVSCTVVHEDESTGHLTVDSLSMRGAMREMTGHFISQGYQPVGRWEITAENVADSAEEVVAECLRRFKPVLNEG